MRRPTPLRLLLPLLVLAHTAGFHERVALSVSEKTVDALVVMDLDAGEQARLIRAGADLDHDGAIAGPERTALERKLVAMVVACLELGISG